MSVFDLMVSAKYAERMVTDGGWTYCSGASVGESPALYFPFFRTCPRCSVKRGIRPRVKSNKPQSDTIGEIASDATVLILSAVIGWISADVKIAKSDERQGDVDTVIYDKDMIVLAEIKSSPLSVFPLEIKQTRRMTEVRDGASGSKQDHSPATADIDKSELSFYLPHVDLRIPLGKHGEQNWPYPALINFVSNAQNLSALIAAWKELYDVYVSSHQGRGGSRDKNVDSRKWFTCGCGGEVDDGKNAPGLDRPDDIKKGTYQVLKFGTYYKEKCPRRIIRAALVSNLLPLHTFERYMDEMQDVIWTKAKYSAALDKNLLPSGVAAFQSDSVFNLYDALLCLTRSIYQDEHLRDISSLDNFVTRFCA